MRTSCTAACLYSELPWQISESCLCCFALCVVVLTHTTDTDMAAAMFATTSPLTNSKAIAVHGPCREDPCTLADSNRLVCRKEKQLIVKNSISFCPNRVSLGTLGTLGWMQITGVMLHHTLNTTGHEVRNTCTFCCLFGFRTRI